MPVDCDFVLTQSHVTLVAPLSLPYLLPHVNRGFVNIRKIIHVQSLGHQQGQVTQVQWPLRRWIQMKCLMLPSLS